MVDLHCHSLFSDGECTPDNLLQKAEKLGLKYFSITDHDSCFAYEGINHSLFSGTLITGVELTATFRGKVIEVLRIWRGGSNYKQLET